jgi:hypothetical protein
VLGGGGAPFPGSEKQVTFRKVTTGSIQTHLTIQHIPISHSHLHNLCNSYKSPGLGVPWAVEGKSTLQRITCYIKLVGIVLDKLLIAQLIKKKPEDYHVHKRPVFWDNRMHMVTPFLLISIWILSSSRMPGLHLSNKISCGLSTFHNSRWRTVNCCRYFNLITLQIQGNWLVSVLQYKSVTSLLYLLAPIYVHFSKKNYFQYIVLPREWKQELSHSITGAEYIMIGKINQTVIINHISIITISWLIPSFKETKLGSAWS